MISTALKEHPNKIEKQFNLGVRERTKYLVLVLEFSVLICLSFMAITKEMQFLNFFFNGEISSLSLSSFRFLKKVIFK